VLNLIPSFLPLPFTPGHFPTRSCCVQSHCMAVPLLHLDLTTLISSFPNYCLFLIVIVFTSMSPPCCLYRRYIILSNLLALASPFSSPHLHRLHHPYATVVFLLCLPHQSLLKIDARGMTQQQRKSLVSFGPFFALFIVNDVHTTNHCKALFLLRLSHCFLICVICAAVEDW
jgi:hypothetical protein